MASRHEIRCVSKDERYNPYERITHVGGVNADGTRWLLPQQDAIVGMKTGMYRFFVRVGGVEVDVVIGVSPFGNDYLRTEADRTPDNNLLELQHCPL